MPLLSKSRSPKPENTSKEFTEVIDFTNKSTVHKLLQKAPFKAFLNKYKYCHQ